jgi:DNA-binding MarR family transcriptional regulator
MSSSVAHNLEKAQHILRLATDAALREHRLTTPQYQVLAGLSTEPGLSAAALARRCFVTAQTMTGVVGNLEAAGFVTRTPDPEYGRILRARLTASGAEVLMRARLAVQAVEERMIGELDRAEREALADLLAQCADALKTGA